MFSSLNTSTICLLIHSIIISPVIVNAYKVIGYWDFKSQKRPAPHEYRIEEIPTNIYTHIIYAYATIDDDNKITPADSPDFKKFFNIKKRNYKIKTLISVKAPPSKWSQLAFSQAKRAVFIDSVVKFLTIHDFDGIDIFWVTPVIPYSGNVVDDEFLGGVYEDRNSFVDLVRELSIELRPRRKMITIVGAAADEQSNYPLKQIYDVRNLVKYVDHIHVWTVAMKRYADGNVDVHTPLRNRPYNIDESIRQWIRLGAPKHKLFVGLSFFGRTFTLNNTKLVTPGSPSLGPGKPGPFTNQVGRLAFFEMCKKKTEATNPWKRYQDDETSCKWGVNGNQWVGYDNQWSLDIKAKYAKYFRLGGVAVWHIDDDDYEAICEMRNVFGRVLQSHLTPEVPSPVIVNAYKVIGYWDSKSQKWPAPYGFRIEDIPINTYTHVIYGYATIDDDNKITPADSPDFKRFFNIKRRNYKIKTLISLNGPPSKWSQLAFSKEKRAVFIDSVVKFLTIHNFDGIDIFWVTPVIPYSGQNVNDKNSGGVYEDRNSFVDLVRELSIELKPRRKMITIVGAAADEQSNYPLKKIYDVRNLVKYVDHIHVWTVDMKQNSGPNVDVHTPLRNRRNSIDESIRQWIKLGAPKHKLFVGLSFFGITFTLNNTKLVTPGSPSLGPGKPGPFYNFVGRLAYFELCKKRTEASDPWIRVSDTGSSCKWGVNGNQWVGYDDEWSLDIKANYVKYSRLGGVAVWHIDKDDFKAICGNRNALGRLLKSHLIPNFPNS